jgi:hypothetical protein
MHACAVEVLDQRDIADRLTGTTITCGHIAEIPALTH